MHTLWSLAIAIPLRGCHLYWVYFHRDICSPVYNVSFLNPCDHDICLDGFTAVLPQTTFSAPTKTIQNLHFPPISWQTQIEPDFLGGTGSAKQEGQTHLGRGRLT